MNDNTQPQRQSVGERIFALPDSMLITAAVLLLVVAWMKTTSK
jgi:hypothetical protein